MHNGWEIVRGELDWGYASQPDQAFGVMPVRRNKVVGGNILADAVHAAGCAGRLRRLGRCREPGWSGTMCFRTSSASSPISISAPTLGMAQVDRMPSNRYFDMPHAPVVSTAVEALIGSGFPDVGDHNRPGAVGVGRMPMSTRSGVRVTTATPTFRPNLTPPNLTIRGDAHVDAVTFDGTRATGVQMLDGSRIEAGWIVLCAGTYGSPSVLMGRVSGRRNTCVRSGCQSGWTCQAWAPTWLTTRRWRLIAPTRDRPAGPHVLHSIATFYQFLTVEPWPSRARF